MAKFLNLLKLRSFANAGDAALEVSKSTDTQPRLRVDAGGALNWGDGSSAADTDLYRHASYELKTNAGLTVLGSLMSPNDLLYVGGHQISTTGASTGKVLTYDGTKFAPAVAASGGATVSDTPPSSPTSGQIWFESDTGKTFVYYDSTWVEVGGGGGGTSDPMNDSKFTALITMDIGV